MSFADNALIGQGGTEGTAAVPQKEKTPVSGHFIFGMTNYKFREVWRP